MNLDQARSAASQRLRAARDAALRAAEAHPATARALALGLSCGAGLMAVLTLLGGAGRRRREDRPVNKQLQTPAGPLSVRLRVHKGRVVLLLQEAAAAADAAATAASAGGAQPEQQDAPQQQSPDRARRAVTFSAAAAGAGVDAAAVPPATGALAAAGGSKGGGGSGSAKGTAAGGGSKRLTLADILRERAALAAKNERLRQRLAAQEALLGRATDTAAAPGGSGSGGMGRDTQSEADAREAAGRGSTSTAGAAAKAGGGARAPAGVSAAALLRSAAAAAKSKPSSAAGAPSSSSAAATKEPSDAQHSRSSSGGGSGSGSSAGVGRLVSELRSAKEENAQLLALVSRQMDEVLSHNAALMQAFRNSEAQLAALAHENAALRAEVASLAAGSAASGALQALGGGSDGTPTNGSELGEFKEALLALAARLPPGRGALSACADSETGSLRSGVSAGAFSTATGVVAPLSAGKAGAGGAEGGALGSSWRRSSRGKGAVGSSRTRAAAAVLKSAGADDLLGLFDAFHSAAIGGQGTSGRSTPATAAAAARGVAATVAEEEGEGEEGATSAAEFLSPRSSLAVSTPGSPVVT